jgi:hypothetical protein
MATKMRTGRMTVKTTTKPNGGGGRTQDQFRSMSAEDQYKEWAAGQRKAPNYEYTAGIGRKSGGLKLSDSELEAFNKRQQEEMGYNMKAKEVRYAKGDKGASSGRPEAYQVYYADPTKEKNYYKTPTKVTPSTTPKTPEKMEVGKLPTRKLTISSPQATLAKAPKKKEMVSKAIEGPKGQGRQFKSAPKAGKFTSGNRILKSAGTPGGGAEGRKFRKEEKLAGAYVRTQKLADKGQGAKSFRGDLKAARKETGVKVGSAIKDTRKAQKFENKEAAGKIKYFTKSKMAETIEKKPTSKGKMQAGKMRYK